MVTAESNVLQPSNPDRDAAPDPEPCPDTALNQMPSFVKRVSENLRSIQHSFKNERNVYPRKDHQPLHSNRHIQTLD